MGNRVVNSTKLRHLITTLVFGVSNELSQQFGRSESLSSRKFIRSGVEVGFSDSPTSTEVMHKHCLHLSLIATRRLLHGQKAYGRNLKKISHRGRQIRSSEIMLLISIRAVFEIAIFSGITSDLAIPENSFRWDLAVKQHGLFKPKG